MTTDTPERMFDRSTLMILRGLALVAGDKAGVEDIDRKLEAHDALEPEQFQTLSLADEIEAIKAVQRQSAAETRLILDYVITTMGAALGANLSLEPDTLRLAIDNLVHAVKPELEPTPEDQASVLFVRDWTASLLERVAITIETGRVRAALMHGGGTC